MGISVFQATEEDDNNKFIIEDVTSKNNKLIGMSLTGTGITVENAYIKNNEVGLYTVNYLVMTEVTFAGHITSTNNKYGLLNQGPSMVHVTGNLNLNRNEDGLAANLPTSLTIAVGGSYSGKSGKSGSGSLTACDNSQYDIHIYPLAFGGVTFEGSDYTCVTTDGPDVPDCKPCYPGCTSSSDHSDDGSGRSLGLGDFVAGEDLDLDFADMGHEEFPF